GFCKTCGYIGKACLGIHKKGRAFQSHIINIHEEGEEKTKVIMRDITEECCKEHPKEKAIFLCKAHDCMICGRCLHSGHLSCGKQVVDLLQEAGTIDNDKVNNMKQALNELKNDSLRLKEESRLKNETNEVQAEKCYKELDSLETRLKRSVEDIIRNVRNETCKYQDENIEAFSCIAAVCDENVVWADEEEKQIEELVTNSFTGHLCLRSKAFNKAVSGPKLKMKENEHKQTFKIFCLKENEIALKCLFEDMRDVCHIQEEVDGSDDGSAVTHDVGNATSAIQKEEHPSPGQFYEEIQETGFIPDNPRGRKICRMLKIAFKRRLVFTIRDEGVITWNDIHHKTDRRPNSQFGYPDPKYLDRVTEDLALNGITENDIQKDDMLQGTLIV
ncbi:DTX3L-like protein, partial [Mya arenaria]